MNTTPSSPACDPTQRRDARLPEMYFEYLPDRYWIKSSGKLICLSKADAIQVIHNYTNYLNNPKPGVRYTPAECLVHQIRMRNFCDGIPTIEEDLHVLDWSSGTWDADAIL